MSEEMRKTQQTLEKSTQILIRQFAKTENRYKLQEFRGEFRLNNDSEMSSFNESWKGLGQLVNYWLTTPQEEVLSNQVQKEKLEVDVKRLKEASKAA